MGKAREIDDSNYNARSLRYANGVVAGDILACKWVRLACQRQLDDLARPVGDEWPYHFDTERADAVCDFIEGLPHVKGRWNSNTIQLEDWQCFILCTIFGWIDADGFRRFRTALILIPRKNAKSTSAAGVGLYMLAADGEPGAEVYTAATVKEQSRYTWSIAQKMARRLPELRDALGIEVWQHSITAGHDDGKFIPLASDSDSLEGLNVHCGIIDELHAHKTREVFDVIDDATGARKQPLKFVISTAGSNLQGVCYEQKGYLEQILEGRVTDESYFGINYTIDADDDWTDPAVWRKANPNWGVSVDPGNLETQASQAVALSDKQNDFLTKRLNVWVAAGSAFFNMLAWEQLCHVDGLVELDYALVPCWFGLDLASKWDLAAFVRLYRAPDHYAIFSTEYLPQDSVEKGRANYDLYSQWAKAGQLVLTPGPITDYEFIEEDLLEWANKTNLQSVCYDQHQATELSTRMRKQGLKMVEVPMTALRLSEPMKAIGAAVLNGKIKHDGSPVLGWQFGNVTAQPDRNENVFPRKERFESKIDSPVAAIMAMSQAMIQEEKSEWNGHVIAL